MKMEHVCTNHALVFCTFLKIFGSYILCCEFSLIYLLVLSYWQGCDYVIALTHMRNPNDVKLAENVDEIDLILGGHDHIYEVKQVSKC